jgi:gliding motility-associated-like protein
MKFVYKARFVRAFIVLMTLLPCSALLAQTTNVTFPGQVCSGSTIDLATALPAGPSYTAVPRANGNVTGQLSITTAATALSQTLNLNTGLATGAIIFDCVDNSTPVKRFALTVNLAQIPRLNTTASWPNNTGCGTIVNQLLFATGVVGVSNWKWSRPDTLGEPAVAFDNSNVVTDRVLNLRSNNITIPYFIEMTGTNGCKNTQTLTYNVIPTPDIPSSATLKYDTICSETGINPFIPKTQLTGEVYFTWTAPAAAGLSGITPGAYNPPNTKFSNFNQSGITNSTVTPINVIYNITPIYVWGTAANAYCAATSTVQYVLTVNPKPQVNSPQTTTACSGAPFRISPSAGRIPSSTQYTWGAPQYEDTTISGGSGLPQTPTPTYQDPPISQILVNRSTVAKTATYNVYARAFNCISQPFDLVVIVNPVPVIRVNSDTIPVCGGSAAYFIPASDVPLGTTYSWPAPQLIPANAITGSTGAANNQSTFAPVLNNNSTVTAYANYRLTPNTPQNCPGAPFNLVVKLLTAASLSVSNQTLAVCSDNNFVATPNPVPAGTVYTWSMPTLQTGVSINSGGQNQYPNGDTTITGNLSYSGSNAGGTASYTIIPKTGECIGRAFTLVVTVRPKPSVATADRIVCSGAPFASSPGSNLVGVPTSYQWGLPDIVPAGSLTGASANTSPVSSITQTLYNSINSVAQATYTVTPVAQGCAGKPFSFVASVNPNPTLPNKDTTICPGLPFSMSPTPLPYITTFRWDAPILNIPNAVTGGSAQATPVPSFSQALTNITNTIDVQATYKLTPFFGDCPGKPFSVMVTVKASPYITDTLNSVVCSESPFSVVMPQSLPQGTLYTWNEPTYSNGIRGGLIQPTPVNVISQTLRNTNSDTTSGFAYYSVTPVANGCTGQVFPVKVKVKSNSAVLTSPLYASAICSGSTFSYTPTSNFPSTAFIWSRDSMPGLANGRASGYADINEVLTDTSGSQLTVKYNYSLMYNGCVNPKTQSVTMVLNPMPKLVSPLQPTPICSERTFNYTPVSSTRDVSFSWARSFVVGIQEPLTSGTGSISEKLTNNTFNTVRVPYVYTLTANGCTQTQTVYEIVNPVLTLNDQTQEVCTGRDFNISPPNSVNAVFLWNMPKMPNGLVGATENKIVPLPSVSGKLNNLADTQSVAVYEIVPIIPGAASGGCLGNPFKLNVVVNPVPVLSSPTTLPAICSGSVFNYVPTSKTPGTIFTWSREAIPGLVNPASKGTFNISETLVDSTTLPVTVTYRYRTSFNGCTDSLQYISFTLNSAPVLSDRKVTICSGTAFSLPTDLMPLRTTYTWDVPAVVPLNTLTAFRPAVTPATMVYDSLVNLTNIDALAVYTIKPANPLCSLQPFNVMVTVKPASLVGDQTTNTCNNKLMNFTPTGVPAGTTFRWKFTETNPAATLSGYTDNDTLFLPGVTQTLRNSGNSVVMASYLVSPITNGCAGLPFRLRVSVNPTPTVRLTGAAGVCEQATDSVQFRFTGTGPWSIQYIDNKDNILNQISAINAPVLNLIQSNYPLAAEYRIKVLSVSDAFCSNVNPTGAPVAEFAQTIHPLPLDSVIAPQGTLICLGQSRPLYVNANGRTYQWFRNDTIISGANAVNFEAFFSGSYNARVTDRNGCTNMTVNKVRMFDLRNWSLRFTNDPINCINAPKQFINLSDTSFAGQTRWTWNFNNEDSAKTFNAMTTFKKPGLKKISLSAHIGTCMFAITRDSLIDIAAPIRAVHLPSVTTNANRPVQLTARAFEGQTYRYDWQPGWGLDAYTLRSPVFTYNKSQVYYVNMISREGCVTTDTLKVHVFDSSMVDVLVPKAFSPNGDGVNDLARAYPAGLKTVDFFRVFDRYGRLVFETRNPSEGWNGKYRDRDLPMEVYHWVARGVDFKGNTVMREGNILLVR